MADSKNRLLSENRLFRELDFCFFPILRHFVSDNSRDRLAGVNHTVQLIFAGQRTRCQGFKADGTTSTGTVKYTVQDGTNSLKSWQYVDLSSLGEISSLKVNYEASEDMKGKYGYNAPAYLAVDDVEIYK